MLKLKSRLAAAIVAGVAALATPALAGNGNHHTTHGGGNTNVDVDIRDNNLSFGGSATNSNTNNANNSSSATGGAGGAGGAGGSATGGAGGSATGGSSSADNNGNNNGNNGNNNSSSSNDQNQNQNQNQSNANDNSSSNNSSQEVNVNNNSRRNPVSTAFAAPLVATDDTCMGSSSAGIQGVTLGLSLGTTWNDSNCRRLKNSRQLVALGYPDAATALMCVDDEVRHAMEEAGTPCPVGGAPLPVVAVVPPPAAPAPPPVVVVAPPPPVVVPPPPPPRRPRAETPEDWEKTAPRRSK